MMHVSPYAPPANPGLTPVQNAVFPSSQLRHRPSATLNGITTRSPFFKDVTPSPSSSTIPIFSWPLVSLALESLYFRSILPKVMPGSAAVLPSYMLWGTVSFNVPIHRPSRSFPKDLLQVRAADRSLQFVLAQTFLGGIH